MSTYNVTVSIRGRQIGAQAIFNKHSNEEAALDIKISDKDGEFLKVLSKKELDAFTKDVFDACVELGATDTQVQQ